MNTAAETVETLLQQGVALAQQGRLDDAGQCFQQALQLQADNANAHYYMAVLLVRQQRYADAVVHYQRVLQCRPNHAETHFGLGFAWQKQGFFTEATACYRQALLLQPGHAGARHNLGDVLTRQGIFDEAMAHYQEAIRIQPDFAEAHVGLATLLLMTGNFAQGWPEFEWRWRTTGFAAPACHQPRWDGSPLAGRTLLLVAEQGLGDTLQFIRYASLIPSRSGRVIVQCQAPLHAVLAKMPGIDQLVVQDAPLPGFDVYAPIPSLAGIFGTSLATVPAVVPYLRADEALVQRWRQELDSIHGFKIGIAWQGNPSHRFDTERSIPLPQFAPFGAVKGVELLSLQVGPGIEQLREMPDHVRITDLGSRFDPTLLTDAAAMIMNLDLVITVDTAIAHLAGALGVPVWVALPWVADWRWLLEREDSPWYPGMRLFRQNEAGNWQPVMARMVEELRCMVLR